MTTLESKKAYNQRYYVAHREEMIAAQQKRYLRSQELNQLQARLRYQKNRLHLLEQKREYTKRTAAQKRIYNQEYAKKNREQLRVKGKAYRQANRELVNARNRAYHKKNPDKLRAWNQKWRDKNPVKLAAYDARRRALENGAVVPGVDGVMAQWFYEVVHNQEFLTCAYCYATVEAKKAHVDHIIPLARGGRHEMNNFCISCAPCNQSKNDSLIVEWKSLPDRMKPLAGFW